MADNYLKMLRAKNLFRGPRPLGMPEIDDGNISSMFRSVTPHVTAMKNDDMRRQQEMMEFQANLARRNQPQPAPMTPVKKNVVYGGIHPPTMMQQQFRQDDLAARGQRDRMAQLGATQTGALNNALMTNKQQDDAQMARTVAEINGRADVARSNKESVERAANDARTDKAKTDEIARTQKGPLVNVMNPRTNQMESRQYDPVTRKYAGITLDDDQAGTGYKQGTIPKPVANAGQDPAQLKAAREMSQSIINDLDQLLDEKGNLREHTADAVGKSRILGNISEATGLGSFTPSTTKGRAGINQLKGKLVLEAIGKLKRQSKTGATGFGAMNVKELTVLENAASKLNATDMSDDAYKDELNRIRMALQSVMRDSTEDEGGGSSRGSSDIDSRADELIRRARGGR